MPKLLSGYIAKQLGKHLGKQVKPATLIKVTNTARTPGNASGGLNPTEASYSARGWVEEYVGDQVESTTARREARAVALLGATIAGGQVPVKDDKVTIESVTYRITKIRERDPDAAVWVVEVVK